MRRQQKVYPYVLLALSLFCLLNFSHQTAQRWRLFASEIASPLWRVCFYGKEQAALLLSFSWNPKRETEAFLKKAEQLQRENQALRIELDHLHEWVTSEDRVEEQMLRLKAMEQEKLSGTWEESLQRRRKLLAQVLKMQSKGILAKVVYRDPACWSSFLCIFNT